MRWSVARKMVDRELSGLRSRLAGYIPPGGPLGQDLDCPGMATLDDARRIALELPETSERISWGLAHWRVRGNLFAWERPLRRQERADLGDAAPDGEIVGVRVADEGEKEALIAAEPEIFFTTPHFDGYPAVLIRLGSIAVDELTEVITDAWLDRAPHRLTQTYLAERGTDADRRP